MSKVLAYVNEWPMSRRAMLLAAFVSVSLVIFFLIRIYSTPSWALLYGGLDAAAAGAVVSSLDAEGVRYEVRQGSIYVSSSERDRLRVRLAEQGLPANGISGYELLDNLSGFGTTAQMFDAAYWRAKEGEIARTISSSPSVRAARVLIANPPQSPFQRGVEPKASVHVSSATGMLSPELARAFQYLVASAVAGLQPSSVSVIDAEYGLIDLDDGTQNGLSETDREEALRNRALRILEARVGVGNARVEVAVETNSATEEIVERRINPDERVAISTDTENRSSQRQEEGAAGVTVASNLPEGDAGAEDSSSAQENETRERVNYEISETRRELLRVPGDVERITVAVLVNGRLVEGEGLVPREAEELNALAQLVGAAIGLNEQRGDNLTIQSMIFAETEAELLVEQSGSILAGLDVMTLIQIAALVLVALIVALFVIRPALLRPEQPLNLLSGEPETEADSIPGLSTDSQQPAIASEVEDENTGFELPAMGVMGEIDVSDLPEGEGGFELPDLSGLDDDPVQRLKALIENRPVETVELLRSWIEESNS